MLARISAWVSLVLGLWSAVAGLTIWGAGAALAPLALLTGLAALRERPAKRTRRVALVGVRAAGFALAAVALWVVLALLGV